jgi:hypothetical protein
MKKEHYYVIVIVAVMLSAIAVMWIMSLQGPGDYAEQLRTLGYKTITLDNYRCPSNPFVEYREIDNWNEFRAILARSEIGGCNHPEFIKYDKVMVSYDNDWVAFGTTDEIIYVFSIGG